MKSVRLHCSCGSTLDLNDDAESLINEDSSPDRQGRKFLIEVRADEWQDRHQPCIAARVKAITEAGKKSSVKSTGGIKT